MYIYYRDLPLFRCHHCHLHSRNHPPDSTLGRIDRSWDAQRLYRLARPRLNVPYPRRCAQANWSQRHSRPRMRRLRLAPRQPLLPLRLPHGHSGEPLIVLGRNPPALWVVVVVAVDVVVAGSRGNRGCGYGSSGCKNVTQP